MCPGCRTDQLSEKEDNYEDCIQARTCGWVETVEVARQRDRWLAGWQGNSPINSSAVGDLAQLQSEIKTWNVVVQHKLKRKRKIIQHPKLPRLRLLRSAWPRP